MNTLISRSRKISKLLQSSSLSSSKPHTHHHYRYASSLYRNSSSNNNSRSQKVSVWWDMNDCRVPTGVNVISTTHSIIDALRCNGIMGPVQISAFGDIPNSNHKPLSSAGVKLVQIPKPDGETETVDQSVILNLRHWVSQNSPPAHIFLISGDEHFANTLHSLRRRNYNILLAAREHKQTPEILSSAASIMWDWDELAKGKNLSGMHFDKIPEKEDPFPAFGRQNETSPKIDDSSNAGEQSLDYDYEHRRISRSFIDLVRSIRQRYPEGVSITEFQNQLELSDVAIDKAFYGYGTLSLFLLALPHCVVVEYLADGEMFVRYPPTRVAVKYHICFPDDDTAYSITVAENRWVDCGLISLTKTPPKTPPDEQCAPYRECSTSDDGDIHTDDDDIDTGYNDEELAEIIAGCKDAGPVIEFTTCSLPLVL